MSKVLAIGDIHTKQWIFDLVESVIDNYDMVVFCGDYADDFGVPAIRSVSTWYRLHDFVQAHPGKVQAVRGNHDYIYTVNTPTKQSGYDYVTQTLINSPEHKKLKQWLSDLPLMLKLDGVWYAHAGLDERWSGDFDVASIWQDVSPIWTRPEWAKYKKVPQVVGHTPQKTCTEIEPNIWLIDTFSTYPDGTPYGDGTMLEVIDGKTFNKIKLQTNIENNNNSSSFEAGVS